MSAEENTSNPTPISEDMKKVIQELVVNALADAAKAKEPEPDTRLNVPDEDAETRIQKSVEQAIRDAEFEASKPAPKPPKPKNVIKLSGGTLDEADPTGWNHNEEKAFPDPHNLRTIELGYRRLPPDEFTGVDPMQAVYIGRRKKGETDWR